LNLRAPSTHGDLFYLTRAAREGCVFVLQWHALHYILQQLDIAFAELTGSLRELLAAMHGDELSGSG